VTRIVCCQLAPRIGDLAANRERTLRAIAEAVAAGGEIVVLPELSTSGYVFASRDEAASVAVAAEDDLFSSWAEAAGGSLVVGGFCELGDDGRLYNSAAVVADTGLVAVYRKTHLWDREKLIFTPGAAEPPVVETPFGRVGVVICYDLEFPELTRAAGLRGADLLVVPTNWPRVFRPPGERPPEVVIAMAAARTNRIFIACCDRVGTEREQEWTGGTVVIDQRGWVLATADEEGMAVADVDLLLAREKALSPLSDVFGDRRPELYAPLGAPVTAGVGSDS
jgi:5-aminopentanamidase